MVGSNTNMQATSLFLFGLAIFFAGSFICLSQTPPEINAAMSDISKRLEIEEQNSESGDNLRSEIYQMIADDRYSEILSLLEGTIKSSTGRGILYDAILNAKRYRAQDLPFLSAVFTFAVQENSPGEFERQRVPLTEVKVIPSMADRILLVLGQQSLIRDPHRQLLQEDPQQWLETKFQLVLNGATDAELISGITSAYNQVKRNQTSDIDNEPRKPQISPTPPVARPNKSIEQKPEPLAPVGESPSPTRWPMVPAVVVAALGLLWLLLKKRK